MALDEGDADENFVAGVVTLANLGDDGQRNSPEPENEEPPPNQRMVETPNKLAADPSVDPPCMRRDGPSAAEDEAFEE